MIIDAMLYDGCLIIPYPLIFNHKTDWHKRSGLRLIKLFFLSPLYCWLHLLSIHVSDQKLAIKNIFAQVWVCGCFFCLKSFKSIIWLHEV